jgi:hypothetical protein
MIQYDILEIKNTLAQPVHDMTKYVMCSLVRSAII